MMPKVVSLFSGCGGSDAGVVAAGFQVVMANDVVAYAKEAYIANLPEVDYILGDVAKIKSFPEAELLIGCYPCQGYSQGGAREADRKVNKLYLEFARALAEIQPKAFVAENVSGLRHSNHRHILEDQLSRFSVAGRHGYGVTWSELKCQEYGVPQERRRLIIVGLRKDLGQVYTFPESTHGPGRRFPYTDIGAALAGLPEWPVGEFCTDPFHWYYLSRNRRRNWNEISKTIVSHMRHVPLHPISPNLRRIHTDKWEFEDDRPARRFSYREAAMLQGFYSRYLKHRSPFVFPEVDHPSSNTVYNQMRQRYKIIGNAVPPPLFEAVVRALPDIWG